MRIDIARMDPRGERFEGEEAPSILDLPAAEVRAEEPVRYDLHAELVSGELIVFGRIWGDVELRCCRCSKYFAFRAEEGRFQSITEIDDTTEYVDLTPEIRESMILAFPSYPVCAESCKGLCAQCGVDLNDETCSCTPPADGRWDALGSLKLD